MDNHENVFDIEALSNANKRLYQLLISRFPDEKVPRWSQYLYAALKVNDWEGFHEILERVPETIYVPVGRYDESILVVAIKLGVDMRFIKALINMTMPPQKLVYSREEISTERNASAIHEAAVKGNYSAVKLLISKYPPMLEALDFDGKTPIQTALAVRKMEMACYMLKVALSHVQNDSDKLTFANDLDYAIKKRHYEFAYILIHQCPKLALQFSPWKIIIEECIIDLPCQRRLNFFESIIDPWIQSDEEIISKRLTQIWEDANTQIRSTGTIIQPPNPPVKPIKRVVFSPIESVGRVKLMNHLILGIVRGLCEGVNIFKEQDRLNTLQRVFCSAVENGMYDIVEVILQIFPNATEYKDEEGNNALQFASSHRDGKTFHLVHEHITNHTRHITSSLDYDGNNILHLVAKRARQNKLGSDSGEVLQLQHEFQWYKAMEKILPSDLKFKKNSDKKVPFEVFDEEHRDMLKSESDWITSMASSCMVAGSLIAAVVFAAAITLPGGNSDNGFPNFSKDAAFNVFAISDAVALVFSLIAVVTFLSIFTTRYSIANFQYDLPNRLIIGLTSLLISVTSMMIAFSATVYLLFAKDYNRIIYPTIVVSLVPVLFFAYLQLPSLLNIIKSTYGRDIFKDNNVTIFS